ncbi:hypothetical protein KA183_12495 [bacterium]|nr:hypothetical protein [bacterium]
MKRFLQYCLPALSVLILSAQPSFAADSTLTDSSIVTLENHFFEHNYPSDDNEKRVERLEKLVFGESKTGDIQARLQSLKASMPKDTDAAQLSGTGQSSQVAQAPVQNQNNAPAAPQAQDTQSTPDDPSTDYPRVDAAEHLLLGKTFQQEPINRRLDQLEVKAFGKSSGNPDLSDRVDKLDDYIQTRYHQSIAELTDPRKQLHYSSSSDDVNTGPITLNRNPQFPSASSNAPSVNAPLQDQVSWMEQKIFGQSMQNSPMSLLDRVKRLEGQVFPGEATDTTASLPMQIKVLMNAVELSVVAPPRNNVASAPQQFNHQVAYNQPNYAQPAYSQQSQYQPQQSQQQQQQAQPEEQAQSKGHPFLKSLAKTLMTVGSMAASSMSYGSMGGMNNMGMGGMSGYNPMGYGGMPLNMGGGGPSGFMW